MILTQSLAIGGNCQVGDVKDFIVMSVTECSSPEVILTWQVDLSIVTSLEVRKRSSVHAGTFWSPDAILEAFLTVFVSGTVTVVMQLTSAPVFSSLLSPVAPVVALRLILTDGLAVGGCVEMLHLHDQVLVRITKQTLGHVAGWQRSDGNFCSCCCRRGYCSVTASVVAVVIVLGVSVVVGAGVVVMKAVVVPSVPTVVVPLPSVVVSQPLPSVVDSEQSSRRGEVGPLIHPSQRSMVSQEVKRKHWLPR